MRIGAFAEKRNTLFGLIAAAATCTATVTSADAQMPYGADAPSARPVHALYTEPSNSGSGGQQSSYVDAYGNPLVVPAGFHQGCGGGGCNDCYGGGCYAGGCNGGCGGGGGFGHGHGYGGFNGCMPMGAGGTDPPIGYDLMNDVGMEGNVFDQRGPHYFDVRAEGVYFQRDETFEQDIDFTALNVGNVVVLSSSQLEYDEEPGFRILGRYDIGPLSVVEFGYMGIYSFETSASVTDPTNNLFSLFSRPAPEAGLFGTSPVGVNLPGGPNPESERASRHAISLESDLQTAEVSYRRYWLGYSTRISGTLLAGFRYTRLDEDFTFRTQGSEPATLQPLGPLAAMRYDEECENNLAGFQLGGDIWVSLCQGVRIGSEAKAGLYNNHYVLTNEISTTPPGTTPPTLYEEFKNDHAAFLTEGSVDIVFDITPSISLRAGYEALFMNSLVLAGDNFNQFSPYGNQGVREPFVDDDGEAFFHGGHVGIEYIW